jgi:hypothetical protein
MIAKAKRALLTEVHRAAITAALHHVAQGLWISTPFIVYTAGSPDAWRGLRGKTRLEMQRISQANQQRFLGADGYVYRWDGYKEVYYRSNLSSYTVEELEQLREALEKMRMPAQS